MPAAAARPPPPAAARPLTRGGASSPRSAPLAFNPEERFGTDARDLLTGLLQKSPELRLGSSERDGAELREHAWFATIDWAKLEARELEPSFKPNVKSATDTSNFDDEFTSQPIAESVMPETALGGKGQQYEGFTYVDKGHLG